MRIFRGDTFTFDFSANFNNGTPYIFQAGDVLKVGLKSKITNEEYLLYQEKVIEDDIQTVTFSFSHDETMDLPTKDSSILEVELTDTSGKVSTLYQNAIEIVGDVIDE